MIINLIIILLNFRCWSNRRGTRSILHSTTREMRNQKNKFRKMEHEYGRITGEFYCNLDVGPHTTIDKY